MRGNERINHEAAASRGSSIPLSPAQLRLWFLDRLHPDSPLYNIAVAYRLKGRLDLHALERSLTEIARRHEILRTTFPTTEGEPRQVVHELEPFALLPVDLRHRGDREKTAAEIAHEEAKRPFDLDEGPLMRVMSVQLADADHLLVVTMHHSISDGWSMEIFADELGALYAAYSAGRTPSLPDLPMQYADYTLRNREWLRGDDFQEHLSYWKKKLRGMPPAIELPTDRPRPSVQSFRGAARIVTMPEGLSSSLHEFSRREQTTPFAPLLAAFAVLLSRYTGAEDIPVGTVSAGRDGPELERLIGFFVNTLVLRIDLSGDPRFGELLGRVRETVVEALSHQRVPFDALVDALEPERDTSRSPLVQAMIAVQNAPTPAPRMPGITARATELYTDTSKFDLLLSLSPEGGTFTGYLEYSTDLFDRARMNRMHGHFETILSHALSRPERRISEIPLLGGDEERLMLVEWNDTDRELPGDELVYRLFEKTAARIPDAVAVSCDGEHVTFGHLNRRSNRIANYLHARDVGPETLVGICMDKSPLMIAGLLGVLKAGGAYVPLDPDLPVERLAVMCRDARLKEVLTEVRHEDTLIQCERFGCPFETHGTGIIRMDAELESIPAFDDGPPAATCTGENAAYMIYTSGSTGTPKGVLNMHTGFLNQILWYQRGMDIMDSDRSAFETRLSFDLSVLEIWPFLTAGASIHIPDPSISMQPEQMIEWIIAEGITKSSFATPLAEAMIHEPLPAEMPLRRLMTGGDLLHRGPPVELPFELLNSYGPTEDSVVTTWDPEPVPKGMEHPPPIGMPIDNNRVYILDGGGNPVPIGVPGELWISGSGLARGYFDRPGLTAERFVPDPFGSAPGERIYRSGDLTRYRDDGNIEFLGRIDDQVKVRGFRIELGEIEAILESHPAVKGAAAKTWDDEARGTYIAAYVASHTSEQPSPAELRRFLGEKLPAYMIPAVIVPLERLPLSPNNKIDRAALPRPAAPQPERQDTYIPPRTETERAVARVWREVLGLRSVGIRDNFFDLGGHSLLLARVNAKLNRMFNRQISMVDMFRHPTIASLVDCLQHDEPISVSLGDTERRADARDRLITERRRFRRRQQVSNVVGRRRGGGTEDRYPLSPMQQGMLLHSMIGTWSGVYVQQIICTMKEDIDAPALREAVRRVTDRHTALRTVFRLNDPADLHQEVIRSVEPPFTEEDWRIHDGAAMQERLERFCTAERMSGFDMERRPPVRYALIRTGEVEHNFVWTFHHALLDGRSILIVLGEIFDIYDALTAGSEVRLEQPHPYGSYIDWLASRDTGSEEEFWRDALRGYAAPTPLPAGNPHLDAARAQEAHCHTNAGYSDDRQVPKPGHGRCELRLSHRLTEALDQLASESAITINTIVQGAWGLLLARHGGVEDVAFGAIRACRHIPLPGAASMVGVLINSVPVRIPVPRDETLIPWLEELRSRWVAMREFEHTPLATIQGWSEIPAGEPLFHTLLAFENHRFEDALRAGRPAWKKRTIRHVVDTNFPLNVLAFGGQRLLLRIEYDRARYSNEDANRLLAQLEAVLARMTADPMRRLSDLPILSDEERRLILVDWNRTSRAYPADRCIHEIFAECAAERPDAVAVVSGDACLTYGELNRRADILARRLRSLGVAPEAVVAICLDRSPDLIAALLAVLKAGGAYLPLDPGDPRERLAFMMKDSGAGFVITDRSLRDAVPESPARTILLDEDSVLRETVPEDRPMSPDNIAYVMYTSGSTGTPKGTDICHRGVTRLLFGIDYADLDGDQSILSLATLSFDASTFEMWGSLLHGGRCILAPERVLAPERLGALIRLHDVTTLWLTASLFNTVIEIAPEALSPLGQLLIGGEALSVPHVRRALDALPGTAITNGYGPTEATTFTCCYPIPPTLDPEAPGVPIGRPIANTTVYILNDLLLPAPIGAAGELLVAGPGLARGYRNRPALTAERFVPDAFGDGERVYRTGDRVRRLPDGTIEYIGRLDNQIKIRGFRVEPGEIESVLAAHPAVRSAVVVAREGDAGDKRLTAYVVDASTKRVSAEELRRFLGTTLPPYMIPDEFVTLERMPLTAAGKVDRRSLPDQRRTRPVESAVYVPPPGSVEHALVEIWKEILEIDEVGINDNFFELGGNSILAIKALNKVKNRCRVEIPVVDLFRYPRISALASHIRKESDGDKDAGHRSVRERVERQRKAIDRYRRARGGSTGKNAARVRKR